MKSHSVHARGRGIMRALACVLLAVAACGSARAQDAWPTAGEADLLKGTTRKFDDYGKVGYCDETARLDNFAITLQNESGVKGYLLVYLGRDDLPAWEAAVTIRPYDYLVTSRGVDAGRLKVVEAGYREQRTTELWLVAAEDPAPEPSNTVEVKVDRTKAYQWDRKDVNVEFKYEPPAEEAEGEEGEGSEDEEGEEAADEGEDPAPAVAEAAGGEAAATQPDEESVREAEWEREAEKYEIAVERRGVIEEEDAGDDEMEAASGGVAAGENGAGKEAADKEAAGKEAAGGGVEAAAAADEAPVVGDVKVSLWWSIESFAEALKAEPGSRACLVNYYGKKNADRETVRVLLARALVKMEEQFGLKGDRVVTVDGGYSQDPSVELWVLPRGAEPPKPKANKKRVIKFFAPPGE